MASVLLCVEDVLTEPHGPNILTHARTDVGVMLYEALRSVFDLHLFTSGERWRAERWLRNNGYSGWSGLYAPLPIDDDAYAAKVRLVGTLRRERLYAVLDSGPDALRLGVQTEVSVLALRRGDAAVLRTVVSGPRPWAEIAAEGWVAAAPDDGELMDESTEEQDA